MSQLIKNITLLILCESFSWEYLTNARHKYIKMHETCEPNEYIALTNLNSGGNTS